MDAKYAVICVGIIVLVSQTSMACMFYYDDVLAEAHEFLSKAGIN